MRTFEQLERDYDSMYERLKDVEESLIKSVIRYEKLADELEGKIIELNEDWEHTIEAKLELEKENKEDKTIIDLLQDKIIYVETYAKEYIEENEDLKARIKELETAHIDKSNWLHPTICKYADISEQCDKMTGKYKPECDNINGRHMIHRD